MTTQLTFYAAFCPQKGTLPGCDSENFVVNVVTDIVLPNDRILHFNNHTYNLVPDREATISLPSDMATRLVDFCTTYYVNNSIGFNCHTFVRYIMGWTPTPQHGDASYVVNYHPVPVDATKPHRAYMIRGEQRVEHSMIGIDYPGYSLGVLTENAPLIFARNTELMRIFRGKSLFEVA